MLRGRARLHILPGLWASSLTLKASLRLCSAEAYLNHHCIPHLTDKKEGKGRQQMLCPVPMVSTGAGFYCSSWTMTWILSVTLGCRMCDMCMLVCAYLHGMSLTFQLFTALHELTTGKTVASL